VACSSGSSKRPRVPVWAVPVGSCGIEGEFFFSVAVGGRGKGEGTLKCFLFDGGVCVCVSSSSPGYCELCGA